MKSGSCPTNHLRKPALSLEEVRKVATDAKADGRAEKVIAVLAGRKAVLLAYNTFTKAERGILASDNPEDH